MHINLGEGIKGNVHVQNRKIRRLLGKIIAIGGENEHGKKSVLM